MLPLKITCTCHQAKISICCQTPQVTLIAPKTGAWGFATCWIQICYQICSLTTQGIKFLNFSMWPDMVKQLLETDFIYFLLVAVKRLYISGNIDDYIMFLRSTRLIVADETLNSWTELTVTHLALIESSETIRTFTFESSFCVHTGSILITPSKSQ